MTRRFKGIICGNGEKYTTGGSVGKNSDIFSVGALLYGNSMPSLWLGVSSILHARDAINSWLVAREDAVCVLT